MKRLFAFLLLSLTLACAKAPPNLTPEASMAFKGTQVVKALDLLRDTAVDANAQTPPLLTEDVTRKVVTYHRSTLRIIQASQSGWIPVVQTGLDELLRDLSEKDRTLLSPYISLIKTVVTEVTR